MAREFRSGSGVEIEGSDAAAAWDIGAGEETGGFAGVGRWDGGSAVTGGCLLRRVMGWTGTRDRMWKEIRNGRRCRRPRGPAAPGSAGPGSDAGWAAVTAGCQTPPASRWTAAIGTGSQSGRCRASYRTS